MSSNQEWGSSGDRNHMALSKAMRKLVGDAYRCFDVDMVLMCARCNSPTVFIEATSSKNKATYFLRGIASSCDTPTVLIRHGYHDVNHEQPVDFYLWMPSRTGKYDPPDKSVEDSDWDTFLQGLRVLHKMHLC